MSVLFVAGGVFAVTGAGPAAAQPETQTFSFASAAQTFPVPDNVCEIAVEALGAQGGDGDVDNTVSSVAGAGGGGGAGRS